MDVIEVEDHTIRIMGNKDVLERAVLAQQTPESEGSQMSTRWRSLGKPPAGPKSKR